MYKLCGWICLLEILTVKILRKNKEQKEKDGCVIQLFSQWKNDIHSHFLTVNVTTKTKNIQNIISNQTLFLQVIFNKLQISSMKFSYK